MKKNVLILCTGNSCRSIMAEALINDRLSECLKASSSGVEASGVVNPEAQALLEKRGLWRDEYHSKVIDQVIDEKFDLVVTVCDHAKESCPVFPYATKSIHLGFEDPSGKEAFEYEKTLDQIEQDLLPLVKSELCSEKKS